VPTQLKNLSRLSKGNQLRFLNYCRWLKLLEHFHTPLPIAFSLRAAALMIALLAVMPHNPMAIPTAIGGGISIALIFQPRRRPI
jgi:hypothetical protein